MKGTVGIQSALKVMMRSQWTQMRILLYTVAPTVPEFCGSSANLIYISETKDKVSHQAHTPQYRCLNGKFRINSAWL